MRTNENKHTDTNEIKKAFKKKSRLYTFLSLYERLCIGSDVTFEQNNVTLKISRSL